MFTAAMANATWHHSLLVALRAAAAAVLARETVNADGRGDCCGCYAPLAPGS